MAKVGKKGRILYVEPNDVFGSISDVPLTPDYSDLCISFNLIVEVVSRYKQTAKIGENDTAKYQIFWTSKLGLDQSKNWVSFLGGEELDGKSYLTTYYTDTHYEDILKKNIVEGLGIENITVAFENYYTPTVTIKFVDQRGSSLFGREEATHYNDQLTIDNIFGAFFTAPYPKFKLQIKGFYGKPVTLQLTCSGFKGSLNSNTGNFEATATFIGYSYSLLTDIPFQYIVAAPHCDYFGFEYWNSMVGTEEWKPYKSGGKTLPRISEFVEKVNNALNDDSLFKMLSDEDNEILQSAATEKAELDKLYDKYSRFIGELSSITDDAVIKNFVMGNQSLMNEQILMFSNSNEIEMTEGVQQAFEDLIIEFNSYNESYDTNKLPTTSLPNEHTETFPNLVCIELFEIEETADGVKIIRCKHKDVSEITVDDLCEIEFGTKSDGSGEYRKMENNTAQLLVDYLNRGNVNNIHKYACLVDLHDFRKRINDRLSEIDDDVSVVEQQKERDYVKLAQDRLNLVPYIGNIFKMIMAHVETLVYMMYKCYENIKADELKGYRNPEYLRVNISKTDTIPTNRTAVPAWPMVTRASSDNNENKSLEDENTLGWVGDFSPYFEEEKLIRSLFLACKKVAQANIDFKEVNARVTYIPVAPNDVNDIMNVFNVGPDKNNISYLAGMLGLRATQLFGIMERGSVQSDIAETMGRMDAYNYFISQSSKSEIKDKIIDVAGNESLTDKMLKIMLCDESEDNMGEGHNEGNTTVHPFETNKGIMNDVIPRKNRCPIFVQSGSNLKYVRYYTKSRHGLVPSVIKEFDSYNNDEFTYRGEGTNTYFDFNNKSGNESYEINKNFLFNTNIKTIYKDKENTGRYKNAINFEKFNDITDSSVVNGILKRYDELKTENFKIMSETYNDNFSKVLERYWDVEEASYSDFFKKNSLLFTKLKGVELSIDVDGEKKTYTNVDDYLKDLRIYDKTGIANLLNTAVKVPKKDKNDSVWKINDESLSTDSLCIPFIKIRNWDVGDNNVSALFGSSFYYLQNNEETTIAEKNKALLFLHAMAQNAVFAKTPNAFKSDKTHASIQTIPYSLTLLYGGLLWRHKYIVDNGADPIVFEMKNKTYSCKFKKASLNNGNEAVLYNKSGEKNLFCFSRAKDGVYNVHIKDVFGGELPDYNISNALIFKFEEFVNNEWKTIAANCELKVIIEDRLYKLSPEQIENIIKDIDAAVKRDENPAESGYEKYFGDTAKNFKIIGVDGSKDMYVYLNDENESCQRLLRGIYCNKNIVLDVSNQRKNRETLEETPTGGTDVTVSVDTLKSYLNGFSTTLKKISEKQTNVEINEEVDSGNPDDPDIAEFTRDVAIPIYLYLKMLWDKWLSGSNATPTDHEFTVKNFFGNFVFIDSFYRNIESRLMTNCQVFLEVYDGNTFCNQDSTVFKAIGDLTTRHHCLFLAIPDFIDNLASEKPDEAVKALESMFVPMPYDEQPPLRRNNRFVIIYVPKLSETPSELNNYKEDGFNIWSYNDSKKMTDPNLPKEWVDVLDNENDELPAILKKNTGDFDEDLTRYGYFVPSFGLAYGHQHNHLFKNVNLNMETPVITSAVINTLSHIARQGSANEHKVAFIGQDLYPVFSNYSYICEFEMMGCAQVQPLMYFQLMNVPMWRGTYMIFNVTHTMTPGNMVTKVKAMKLSNRAVPYSNAWFTKNMAYKGDGGSGTADPCETDIDGYDSDSSTSGDTSYDYDKYRHLVNKNDRSKYINMDKVLEGVTTLNSRNLGTGYKLPYNQYRGACSSGPSTWYGRGGITIDWWADTGSPFTSMRADTWMTKCGFVRVHNSPKYDIKGRDNSYPYQKKHGKWSGLEPGDIMIIFARHAPGSKNPLSCHAAMYTGKDWRSDCVQRDAACEWGLREPSEGGSIQIWRFSDKLYEQQHPNAKPIN